MPSVIPDDNPRDQCTIHDIESNHASCNKCRIVKCLVSKWNLVNQCSICKACNKDVDQWENNLPYHKTHVERYGKISVYKADYLMHWNFSPLREISPQDLSEPRSGPLLLYHLRQASSIHPAGPALTG